MDQQLKTTDIDNKLSQVDGFLGAFAYDEIPQTPMDGFSMVVNDEPSTEPGSHWIAIVLKDQEFFFIDSYGRSFKDPMFTDQFRGAMSQLFARSKVICNNIMIQSFLGNTCGQYAVYFICEMVEKSFKNVLSVFTDNLKKNDKFVINYFKRI